MPIRLVPINVNGQLDEDIGRIPPVALEAGNMTAALYARNGFRPPWIGYFAMRDGELVGTCAFKAPPADGRVEIAYFTFPDFEGQGVAKAMAKRLLAIADATREDVLVTAFTAPEANASNAILQGLGFEFAGAVEHPEDGKVWEWQRVA
jgi:ribosomal-protein-alanine N-acetyltransferase